jgi:hypothetical protein
LPLRSLIVSSLLYVALNILAIIIYPPYCSCYSRSVPCEHARQSCHGSQHYDPIAVHEVREHSLIHARDLQHPVLRHFTAEYYLSQLILDLSGFSSHFTHSVASAPLLGAWQVRYFSFFPSGSVPRPHGSPLLLIHRLPRPPVGRASGQPLLNLRNRPAY